MEAIQYASEHYVMLDELHDRVGERIAAMVRCEAAMVTSGAASALTLGTAAVLTGTDRQKIVSLPNLAGMKSEAIVQKSHRFGYITLSWNHVHLPVDFILRRNIYKCKYT